MRARIAELTERRPPKGNWGLAHQAYLAGHDKDHAPKKELFRSIADETWPEAYRSAFWGEWQRALAQAGACVLDARTTAPFALGLGEENVHEVGLTLHRTYGVPYIPGSSVKGAMRRALAEFMGIGERLADTFEIKKDAIYERYQPDAKLNLLLERLALDPQSQEASKVVHWARIFGTTGEAGLVTFLDAMPNPAGEVQKPIMLDTVTVHHPDYYQKKNDLPSDMDDPTPVAFLSVRPGVVFSFAFMVPHGREQWSSSLTKVLHWLLEHQGLGAKTNSGYGRFALLESADRKGTPIAAPGGTTRGIVQRIQGNDLLVQLAQGDRKMCMNVPATELAKVKVGSTIEATPDGRVLRFLRLVD
ncbi:MAG: hypothetical protein AMXMBFR81_30480 [Chthonomonas sp.]